MKNSIILGSVSFQDSSRKDEFLRNLELIDSALVNLEFDCRRNSATWQNLNSTPSQLSIIKFVFFHCWFESQIHEEKNRFLGLAINFITVMARVVKDLIFLSRMEFYKKHLNDHLRIKYITDKHLRIIGNFLDSDSDYLLVCEDDIILDVDPRFYLEEILRIADLHQNPLFVTICNNSSYSKVSDYFGGKTEKYADSHSWVKIDFFVNGCAMYFLNREMAVLVNDFVVRHPIYRNCAIDWLLSLIGRNTDDKDVACLIPKENYVSNGSRE